MTGFCEIAILFLALQQVQLHLPSCPKYGFSIFGSLQVFWLLEPLAIGTCWLGFLWHELQNIWRGNS